MELGSGLLPTTTLLRETPLVRALHSAIRNKESSRRALDADTYAWPWYADSCLTWCQYGTEAHGSLQESVSLSQ